jgi:acyl-CoA reductase-like NAD-dependent aldehyde dehydrogenase
MIATPPRPALDLSPRRLFIGGAWVDAAGGEEYDVLDPALDAPVTRAASAGAADVEAAVTAARRAFDSGGWSQRAPRERGRVLLRAAELMREHAEELAVLESICVGKPIAFTRMIDVPNTIDTYEYYGALATGLEGAARPLGAETLAYTRREPIGVVAAITPFNFPLILSASKLAPALVAGNTVVHKPAQEAPLSALLIAELLQEAGVPDGVLNVLTGGVEPGEALVTDPRVDKVAFTGSTNVGRRVARLAADTLKQVTVELGGKSANLVFADADLDSAVQTAIQAFVFNTGQFCMAGSRLLVERPVYEQVKAAVAGALEHIPLGDPFVEGTVIGPMAGRKHLAKVDSFLREARAERLLVGGDAPLPETGLYVAPALLDEPAQESRFIQEEIFGPVATIQAFDSEEEAVALANGTTFGLAAGLQTQNLGRAHRVAAQLQAGIVWVNAWGQMDAAMPFGGYKQSGYGRENGPEGLDGYLQTKSVIVALSE